MKYIENRGVKVPLIGFGTWRLGDNPIDEEREIETYIYGVKNHKMTLIDTAEMYGLGKSEAVVGKIVKELDRKSLFIIDKIMPNNAIAGNYISSCKKSLELVGVDYFDLYLLHWRNKVDLQDMVYQMEELKRLGLIKEWGVSNFDTADMEDLFKCDKGSNCFCNQILYSIDARGPEFDLIPWCKKHEVLVMAYSPLCNNKEDRMKYTTNQKLIAAALSDNKTPESLMLSFVIRNNNVATIFKTANIDHLENNMKNVFEEISDDALNALDEISPKPTEKVFLKKI